MQIGNRCLSLNLKSKERKYTSAVLVVNESSPLTSADVFPYLFSFDSKSQLKVVYHLSWLRLCKYRRWNTGNQPPCRVLSEYYMWGVRLSYKSKWQDWRNYKNPGPTYPIKYRYDFARGNASYEQEMDAKAISGFLVRVFLSSVNDRAYMVKTSGGCRGVVYFVISSILWLSWAWNVLILYALWLIHGFQPDYKM